MTLSKPVALLVAIVVVLVALLAYAVGSHKTATVTQVSERSERSERYSYPVTDASERYSYPIYTFHPAPLPRTIYCTSTTIGDTTIENCL